jgi:hypothetical protein
MTGTVDGGCLPPPYEWSRRGEGRLSGNGASITTKTKDSQLVERYDTQHGFKRHRE